ncbi:hypothetical protein SNOG_08595 [Parastagonospora nodorum SN15]|uniref:Uncharacterized protein n=1 Tax=Phaeosphaeria nodorum (strain SN15 / ATCC MYA-4574 / FGSC 10173) TaxID=321614 RepID=Q0UI19_PHANO|nr:hypothetical protein SNOG_08595 [Parastagonospora nodorum SN15]EAT83763.1 hypothetical protein SNOG_08595 [Parastagonospora nodorum SN15]
MSAAIDSKSWPVGVSCRRGNRSKIGNVMIGESHSVTESRRLH